MRNVALAALAVAALGAAAAFSFQGLRPEGTRTLVLVARDMAFVSEAAPGTNPALMLRPGERVRLVLQNQDRGMKHDLLVRGLGLRTRTLDYGESDALVFRTPEQPGTLEYVCSFHAFLMRGTLVVPRR
jgi:plastocyanin